MLRRVIFVSSLIPGLIACASYDLSRHAAIEEPPPASPHDYLVFLPAGYTESADNWPVLFVLHGVAEVGTSLGQVAAFGPAKQIELGLDLQVIVISPQLFGVSWNQARVLEFIEYCLGLYRIDRQRIYLTGTSLGGRCVWKVAAAKPELFAAIAPVAGWGTETEASRTSGIPAWLFHGEDDSIVPVSASKKMYELHRARGGDTRLTVIPDVGHTIWDEVYGDEALYDWFLAHYKDRITP